MNSETYVTGFASLLSIFFSHFLHGSVLFILFPSGFMQSFPVEDKNRTDKKHLHQGTSELKDSVFFKNLHFKRSRQ